jgi:class III cytochrome C family protein
MIMRAFIYVVTLLGFMLVLFPLPGCGTGEDQPKKVITETAKPQTKGEEKESMPQPTAFPSMPKAKLAVPAINNEIIIENQGYETDRKKPVKFSHKRHNKEYKIACVDCHHVYQDGENLWKEADHVEKCAACHDSIKAQDDVMKLQNAFHKSCKGCHKEVSQKGKGAPYKKCSGCHGQPET